MNFLQLQCLVGTFRNDLVNFVKVMCDFCHTAGSWNLSAVRIIIIHECSPCMRTYIVSGME